MWLTSLFSLTLEYFFEGSDICLYFSLPMVCLRFYMSPSDKQKVSDNIPSPPAALSAALTYIFNIIYIILNIYCSAQLKATGYIIIYHSVRGRRTHTFSYFQSPNTRTMQNLYLGSFDIRVLEYLDRGIGYKTGDTSENG